jgi:hypothetical protein
MAASPAETVIKNQIRKNLKALATFNKGEYDKFQATGKKDGVRWLARYKTLRASNGEVALMPEFYIDGYYIKGFEYHLNLNKAIRTVMAERRGVPA